jgi:ribonucleoside-triphosphate reductase
MFRRIRIFAVSWTFWSVLNFGARNKTYLGNTSFHGKEVFLEAIQKQIKTYGVGPFMGHADHDEAPERESAREGIFDAQLQFPAPFVDAPPPLTHIVKRSGDTVAFDKRKIADSILRASQAADGDGKDRADSLASAVAIYLTKQLKGETPTSRRVGEAVEKVLVEMGHIRTALAYMRYRERRQRARSLQKGDALTLLNDIEEARVSRDMSRSPANGGLFVRTSLETLAGWNRDRIVEALLRETRIDRERANVIAIEVEQQIVEANLTTLTSSLIRELVSAKLIEHGFEEHHRRHMRLGVPLYDVERIIRGPSPEGLPLDPEATDRVLAESVKREFALSQVFSPEVADAHARGDLHVHDLGRVDRLHSSIQSIESITRFGVQLRDARVFSQPPKYPDTLLAQMVNLGVSLQAHFAESVHWDAVNVFFAPFLENATDKEMRQAAQMLIYEYAYRAMNHGNPGAFTEMGVAWVTPLQLRDAEAVCPGGIIGERSYGDYAETARRFAWALFEILREAGDRGAPFAAPVPAVALTPGFFAAEGGGEFLELVAQTVAMGGRVQFVFDREETLDLSRVAWEPREVVAQRVTMNLARAAYRAPNEKSLFGEIERLVRLAARAHAQKNDFIEQLLSLKSMGPLGLLATERDGRPYLNAQRAEYRVAMTGLNECVQYFCGHAMHDSPEAFGLALRILEHVEELCEYWSRRLDLRCSPAQTCDENVDHRFAIIDLQDFPDEARKVVKTNPVTQDLFYTSGARIDAFASLTPMERAHIEGQFHRCLRGDATTSARMFDAETSPGSIADFVRKVYNHSACKQLFLSL